jgi:transcriptional regulator with XRE-family HTH domain
MPISVTPEQIDFLVQVRVDKGFTKPEFMELTGVALRTLNAFESKRRTSFNESTLMAFCRVLEVGYSDWLEGKFGGKKAERGKQAVGEIPEEIINFLSELLSRAVRRASSWMSGFSLGLVLGVILLTTIVR